VSDLGVQATDLGRNFVDDRYGPNKTIDGVRITWYGYNDNDCSSGTGCDTLAFPRNDGWPVPHEKAIEASGAANDPITFATAAMTSGSPSEFAPGTRIYVPHVQKYFVMEDQCTACATEWFDRKEHHVDLWLGPASSSDKTALRSCEDKLARTGQIIVNPSADYAVDTNPIFKDETCTANTY
jgi:hypothetical protein